MAHWSEAFAAQAVSDLDAFLLLENCRLPISHRLHYLQMWLEKLCKAHIWTTEAEIGELKFKHNVVARVLPQLISKHQDRLGVAKIRDLAQIRQLCREIDMLHPQVDDDGRRPDNVEYPWHGQAGSIEIPCRWKFALAERLYTNAGRQLLKAAIILTRDPTGFFQ